MKRRRKNNKGIILLVALVAVISIAYASIVTNLNINGTGTVGKPSWDIHFENVAIKEGSVTTTEADKATIVKDENDEDTIVNYKINLAKPGDFYEFTVDVVNEGSLIGKLTDIGEVKGLTEAQKEFVTYTVTYKDSEGEVVGSESTIEPEAVNTVTVRVEFKSDISKDTLKDIGKMTADELKLDLSYKLTYEQA